MIEFDWIHLSLAAMAGFGLGFWRGSRWFEAISRWRVALIQREWEDMAKIAATNVESPRDLRAKHRGTEGTEETE